MILASREFDAPPPPPSAAEVIAALGHARQLLSDGRGLAKGNALDWIDEWPCWCLVAAITRASRTRQIRDAAMLAARCAMPGRFQGRKLEAFNDDPRTDLGDALWLLDAAKSFVAQAVAA